MITHHHAEPKTTGLILAGGQSRRFGSNKAEFLIDGVTMIETVFNSLSSVASSVIVSVSKKDTVTRLPIPHVFDKFPDCGPLAGIHAGLMAAHSAWILVLATDLPFVKPSLLQQLLQQQKPDIDAVIAKSENRLQPLCGCYRRSLADRIEEHLKNQQLAVKSFLKTIRMEEVKLPAAQLRNINRPEDLWH